MELRPNRSARYTSPGISGPLLDWVGQGLYGISRPVLTTSSVTRRAGYNSAAYNTVAYNAQTYSQSGTATTATDDIYKRVLTWHLYRGDGQVFSLQWLKNRVNRFLNGANGTDYPVLNNPPSITVTGTTFTITADSTAVYTDFQQCVANGIVALPFQYTFVFVGIAFLNNGGVLYVAPTANYPMGSFGLEDGAIFSNGGVVSVVPGVTPNPSAPPVYFSTETPAGLLTLGGGNLPTTNPGVGTGQLWNNGGVVYIA